MAIPPLPPLSPASGIASPGPEWQVGATPVDPTPAGSSFAGMLGQQIEGLTKTQDAAATASQQLATGQAADLNQAVGAVERARLAMELAVQVRGKLTEAYNDVFHTQV
jgi:flagellar hook-basal body complex protein FliE